MSIVFKIILGTLLLGSFASGMLVPLDSKMLNIKYNASDCCYRERALHHIEGKLNSIDYTILYEIGKHPDCVQVLSLKFFPEPSTSLPFIEHRIPQTNPTGCSTTDVKIYRPWSAGHDDFVHSLRRMYEGAATIRDFTCNYKDENAAAGELANYMHTIDHAYSFNIFV